MKSLHVHVIDVVKNRTKLFHTANDIIKAGAKTVEFSQSTKFVVARVKQWCFETYKSGLRHYC